jgi:hypothetical protein
MLVSVGGTQREKNRKPQGCDRRSVVFLNLFCQAKLLVKGSWIFDRLLLRRRFDEIEDR